MLSDSMNAVYFTKLSDNIHWLDLTYKARQNAFMQM